MSLKTLVIVLAGVGAVLLFASRLTASADELTAADGDLALPDQPAGDEVLMKESGSIPPATIVGTNNLQQEQRNTIIVPTAMTMSITKTSSTAISNDSSTASISSSTSATVIHNGVQSTP